MAFALYVSLLPFRLQPVSLDAAWDHFRLAMSSWPPRLPRVNFLANVLLFVPVGFGLCGALRADRERRITLGALLVVLCASVAASLTAEFLQEFAPRRVVSAPDVVAQTIGCGIGIVTWLGLGPELIQWIRETRRPSQNVLAHDPARLAQRTFRPECARRVQIGCTAGASASSPAPGCRRALEQPEA